MNKFSVRLIQYPADWPALTNFFSTVYSPRHILLDRPFFEWQFVLPGFKNFILQEDNAIIGHVGVISPEFLVRGKKLRAGFTACLIVDKKYQGSGAGFFLDRVVENELDMVYSTGISGTGLRLYTNLGWRLAGNLYCWVLPTPASVRSTAAEEIRSFDDEWDRSWRIISVRYVATTDRSAQYLNWRFSHHPLITYKMLALKDGTRWLGYIVARLEESEVRAMRIVDLVSESDATTKELITAVVRFAQDQRVDFVDFFCSSRIYQASLEEVGFANPETKIARETPMFLLPVDRTRRDINWAYKTIHSDLNLQLDDWFIVKADGDRDRPQRV